MVCRVPSTRRPATLHGPCFKTGRTRKPRSRPTDPRQTEAEGVRTPRDLETRDWTVSRRRHGQAAWTVAPQNHRGDHGRKGPRSLARPSSEAGIRRGGRPPRSPSCGPAVTFDARDKRSPGRPPDGPRDSRAVRPPKTPHTGEPATAGMNPPDAPCSMRPSSVCFLAVSHNLNLLFKENIHLCFSAMTNRMLLFSDRSDSCVDELGWPGGGGGGINLF